MLNVVMLKVVTLNVVMLNIIMLNVVMLNVVMLNVIKLNVVMLNAVASFENAAKFTSLKSFTATAPPFLKTISKMCFPQKEMIQKLFFFTFI
jgi:hypothetical protein